MLSFLLALLFTALSFLLALLFTALSFLLTLLFTALSFLLTLLFTALSFLLTLLFTTLPFLLALLFTALSLLLTLLFTALSFLVAVSRLLPFMTGSLGFSSSVRRRLFIISASSPESISNSVLRLFLSFRRSACFSISFLVSSTSL